MSDTDGELGMERSHNYAGGGNTAADAALRMNKRLGADYRDKVRGIAVTQPFSNQWEHQVDSLQYMASVASMEERDSKKKAAEKAGAAGELSSSPSSAAMALASSPSGTLWEKEEFAARYIVEEGKLNLIMRICAEFKSFCISKSKTGDLAHLTKQAVAQGKSFEMSLGVLLRVSMVAVEAVQTLDIRNMMDHIAACWDYALVNPDVENGVKGYTPPYTIAAARQASPSQEKPTEVISNVDFLVLQEGVSVHYIMYLMQHSEQLAEDVLMGKFFEHEMPRKLLNLVEKFIGLVNNLASTAGVPLSTFAGVQTTEFLTAVCGCYVALFSTDTYKARMNEFWPGGKDDKKRWSALIQPIVKSLVGIDPERKKFYRPVTDAILRFS